MLSIVRNLQLSSLEKEDKSITGTFYYEKDDTDNGFWILDDKGVHCYVVDNFDDESKLKIDDTITAKLKTQYLL